MNWGRVISAGVAGGIVVTLANYVLHGVIMANAYSKYPVFSQEAANPLYFFLVGICVGIAVAMLFAKTRRSWGAGVLGGAAFGFFVGLVAFFPPFYNSLVIEGFPYFLCWCWGGIDLITYVIYGLVIGAIYRESAAVQ